MRRTGHNSREPAAALPKASTSATVMSAAVPRYLARFDGSGKPARGAAGVRQRDELDRRVTPVEGRWFWRRRLVLPLEPAEDVVRVESDRFGVGPDEGAPENAARPARDVVGFESLEQGQRDLGTFRDCPEREAPALAFGSEVGPERSGIVHQLQVRRIDAGYDGSMRHERPVCKLILAGIVARCGRWWRF